MVISAVSAEASKNIIILVQAVAKRLVGGPAVIRLAPGSQITAEPDADLYEGRSSLFALKLMLERGMDGLCQTSPLKCGDPAGQCVGLGIFDVERHHSLV